MLSQKHARIRDSHAMPDSNEAIQARVLARFRRAKPGTVLATRDLRDLGSDTAVRQALARAVRQGKLRAVSRGLFDLPRRDPELGELAPSIDALVEALRLRDGLRLLPSGAHAANVLGLSTQVPVRLLFLTDGPTRRIRVGRREIVLKRTTPRQMATAGRISGTVIQALRWLGREAIDESVIDTLRRQLAARQRRELVADARHAPAWVAQILYEVAASQRIG
jgi:hypothetical protein